MLSGPEPVVVQALKALRLLADTQQFHKILIMNGELQCCVVCLRVSSHCCIVAEQWLRADVGADVLVPDLWASTLGCLAAPLRALPPPPAFEQLAAVITSPSVTAATLCIFGVIMKLAKEPRNLKVGTRCVLAVVGHSCVPLHSHN